MIDLDTDYDQIKQKQVDESYKKNGELLFDRYNVIKKGIEKALITDPICNRKKKRARRFMNHLPELSYALCESILETEKDGEVEGWMKSLEVVIANPSDKDCLEKDSDIQIKTNLL